MCIRDSVEVDEPGPEPGVDPTDLRPAFPRSLVQPLIDGTLGRIGDLGHGAHPRPPRSGVGPPRQHAGRVEWVAMVCSPFVIILSDEDRAVLTARARSARCPYRDVVRARIILAAADGTRTRRSPPTWNSMPTRSASCL